MIHHYTTIENLALILESGNIRFSRMDTVDDVKEVDGLSEGLAKATYLSCWTKDDEENIALWKMYTNNMRGVKITLRDNPFKRFIVPKGVQIDGLTEVTKDLVSHLPVEKLYSDLSFFIPMFSDSTPTGKTQSFFKDVEYADDYESIYKNLITRNEELGSLQISSFFDIGKFKSKKWAFQKESRFTIYCFPKLALDHPLVKGDRRTQLDILVNQMFYPNEEVQKHLNFLSHIDVPLDEDSLDTIKITLGPNCTEADKIIVDSLLKRFTHHYGIRPSSLTGDIRFK